MNFLKNIISSAIGFFMAFGLLLIGLVIIGVSLGGESEVKLQNNSILRIKLETPIKDYVANEIDPFSELLGLPAEYIGMNSITKAIRRAKNDPKIKGISIEPTMMTVGMSQLNEIRKELIDFKQSGKLVYAYADFYGQKEYFLSTVADSIFVNPVGQVELKGLSSEVLFFKDFQDKYGVKMEVVRHGKYKSAVEPFLENEMSESNRAQIKALLESLWGDIAYMTATSRKISEEDVNRIADELGGRNADLALENNLVDAAIYYDAYKEKIQESLSLDNFHTISLQDYTKTELNFELETNPDQNKIAVIYAQGEIIYGDGDENVIGQRMMVKAIDKAASNEAVKAIVFRVNSPGGSALSSDIIWRALENAKSKKPLVVSMGNYAASGGYYIACNADRIYAESTTITGSIGVFGILPNVNKFSKNIGINSERVSTNKNPHYSAFSKLDPKFYEVTKQGVDFIYKTFVSKVAEGRGMTYDQVHELAQGRVWSGKEAKENGLVDEIGGLSQAILSAASLAEVDDYKIQNFPNYEKELKDSFKSMPFMKSEETIVKELLGDSNFVLFQKLNALKHKKGIQMAMPYVLEIE
ncbi:signal peptide peptidase SppA [Flavicella marina]|uniref:signal peptide peptidase SppA n=1 Tax=Flavicella marina TaxID=1475951 RepID=UPI001264BBC9|nr:signal peptide peptidase SppA [Flavicella marina]